MTLQPWVFLIGAPVIFAAVFAVWYFIVRTPMRYMIAVTIRYRLIRLLDWFRTIGRGHVRFALTAQHSYEELFDTMLVVRGLDRYHQDEIGLKWTDLMAEEGVIVSRDLTELFMSYPEDVLSVVSLHLFADRFRLNTDPDEIHDFLCAEQRLMAENPDESLGHPRRLWQRFGRGPIYGWRTPLYFANDA